MIIKSITGREILDSRACPTVWAQVVLEDGSRGSASVPSGASVGKYEAKELRDGDDKRYGGKGVRKAVRNIDTVIAGKLEGRSFNCQEQIDDALIRLDGTEDKSFLGANAVLAVSMAAARAYAVSQKMELYEYLHKKSGKYVLPMPMMNILNGGVHAGNNVDIQEFMVMPVGAASFHQALEMCQEVYMALKSGLKRDGLSTGVGDEGGFAPNLAADEQAIEYILKAVEEAGLTRDIRLALDAAASEWYAGDGLYRLPKSGREYRREELAAYFAKLIEAYPIVSLEDGMSEEDFEGFALLGQKTDIQIVGDDLFVTNVRRIRQGIEEGVANSILIKMNQIGTVSEAAEAVELGAQAGYTSIVSHRSGETEDAFIADFAVGLSAGQIKTGAPARGERTAKYNRLLAIEAELGSQCAYLGGKALKQHG